jgi:integrase
MKLPKGVYHRNKSSPQLWIDYPDENGKRIRESAHTTDPVTAEQFRTLRLVQVAQHKLIPTRKFESTTVGEILDYWWERYAKDRPSKFSYLLPRLDKFRGLKARNFTPEMVQDFLDDLLKSLSPSSVNHYRTIINSAFNFAIKWKKYDDNPVIPIKQIPEREARDRFVEVTELVAIIEQCQKEKDYELQAFVMLAACTGMRKSSILSRKWDEVRVDDEYPFIHMPKKDSKNRRANRLPLPALCVFALRQLPSYGTDAYLFPAKPNVKYKDKEKFSKPHAWDLGKRFRRVCKSAGVSDLRIHDLRHFATTMLFMEGVADAIIRKMTGHRSEELERYKHFSPAFKQQTVELIAGQLSEGLATKTATPTENEKGHSDEQPFPPGFPGLIGGADGIRTRDLRRDRPAF